MDSIVNDIGVEIIDLITKIIPLILVPCVLVPLFKLVSYNLGSGSGAHYVDEKLEIPENKEPDKPAGSVTKIYVNSSPVKMEPTSKFRDIPKRCPNCWGIPDNSECCQYCGGRF